MGFSSLYSIHPYVSASWDRGCPDLPACGPWHGSTNCLVWPSFGSSSPRPSRGAKPREADDTKTSSGAASLGWLPRSGDIYARDTSRGSRDVSHDDQGQAGASVQCPRFLFGAKGASAGEESRGIRQRFPYRCNKTKTSRTAGRRSSRSPQQRHHQSLWQTKTTFVRVACTSCPPSNLAVVGSLPA